MSAEVRLHAETRVDQCKVLEIGQGQEGTHSGV